MTGEGILKTEGSRNRNSAVYCVLIPWKYELDTDLMALAICRVRPCLCWENREDETSRNFLNCLQTKRISAKYFLVSSELCDACLKQRKARMALTIGKPKQQVKNTGKNYLPKPLLMMFLHKYSCNMTKRNKQML